MTAENPGRILRAGSWHLIASGTMDEMISAGDEGPCMGIEINIWQRFKVGIHFKIKLLIHNMSIMKIMSCFLVLVFDSVVLFRYDVTSCTQGYIRIFPGD